MHADVIGAQFVVGEGKPEESVAEHVTPASVLAGEARPAQRDQRAVHGRFGAGDRLGQLVQPDPGRIAGQLAQHGEDAVGADESIATVLRHVQQNRLFFR
jgi:hypothetical protein